MTIIATDGHTMVADSWSFSGLVGHPCPTPKIIRTPNGIVGASGLASDCVKLLQWAANGFPEPPPTFSKDDEQPLSWISLNKDGTVWKGDKELSVCPASPPATIGIDGAAYMVEGAMLCGVDIITAVTKVIERCAYVGGPLTVITLDT